VEYNFFTILGLGPEANKTEIQEAFAKKQSEWGQDRIGTNDRLYQPLIPEIKRVMVDGADPDRFKKMRELLREALRADSEGRTYEKLQAIRFRTDLNDIIPLAALEGLVDGAFPLDELRRLAEENGISVIESDRSSDDRTFKRTRDNLNRLPSKPATLYEFLGLARHAKREELYDAATKAYGLYHDNKKTTETEIASAARVTFHDDATRERYGKWLQRQLDNERELGLLESAAAYAPDKQLSERALRKLLSDQGFPLDMDPSKVEQTLNERGYTLKTSIECHKCGTFSDWFAVACNRCGEWFQFDGERAPKCPAGHINPPLTRYCALEDAPMCRKKIRYSNNG